MARTDLSGSVRRCGLGNRDGYVRVIIEVAMVARLRVVIRMGWGRNAVVFVVAIVVVGRIRVGD